MIKNKHLINCLFPTKLRQLFASRISILCIADNSEISDLICNDFFRSPVFTTTQANSFEKAEKAVLSKSPYHCWILDLTPGWYNSGLDLLRKRPNFPYCIVTSNSISLYHATIAIRAGAYGAYDKNSIILSNTYDFIKEMCALSTLSFLLHAQKPERFDMFTLLINHFIRTQEQWSTIYYRNERSIRNICEEYSGLTARQFLFLFHTLNRVLLCDCLIEGMDGFGRFVNDLNENVEFYQTCAAYVLSHFDTVYKPKLEPGL